jgi:hypothetical protein
MADKYWVGGSGTWDNVSSANWAATSGGTAGVSPPTAADNVIFDTLSNGTAYAVTIGTNANALDITIANPATGVVTFSGVSATINCYGSWTNASAVVFSMSGSLVLYSATAGRTITTNAVNLGGINIITNSAGGWTLGGSLTFGGILSVQAGTFNTGNYNITCAVVQTIGTSTRAVTLGTSTITLNNTAPWSFATTTGLTFSGASSTIICSNASPTFAGGGLTYGTVNFTSTAGGTVAFSGANTFTTLNITSSASASRKPVVLSASQTVTGTLTLGAANAYNQRMQVQSSSIVTAQTFTVANINPLSDVDFQNIIAAGASGTWSGTRLGNGLGNTNITFPAAKTVYWNLVAGGNWYANAWATSSGGAPATANFPLAQDTAIIEDTGLTAGNTITIDVAWWIGTFNCTRTNAWTLAGAGGFALFKDFTITSVTTVTYSASLSFSGIGVTQTVTTNGVSLAGGLFISNNTGTVVLNGNLTIPAASTTTLTTGTLDLAGFTLSTGIFSSTNSNTRTLAFGTGKIVVTALNATIWNTDNSQNFTITGTSRVEISGAGTGGQIRGIFSGGTSGTETNTPNFYITAGADNISFGANRKFGTIDFSNSGTSTFTGNFQSENFLFTVYGNLILTASVAGITTSSTFTGPITFGSTSGTKSVTSAGKTYPVPLTFDGIGGTWLCADALTTTGALTLTNGTLQSGGYPITSATFVSTGSGTRSLNLLGKTISVTGTGTVWTGSGTNFSMGTTDTILLNSASAQTFSGGGLTYGVLGIGNANIKTITGSNTFYNIVNTVSPASVTFAAGSTNTFSNFSLNGTSGNLVSLRSTVPGTQYTLVKI